MCIRDSHRGMHTINKKIRVETWGGNVRNARARITSVEIFVLGVGNQDQISGTEIRRRISTYSSRLERTAGKHRGAMEFISSMRRGTGRAVPPPERKTEADNGSKDPTIVHGEQQGPGNR